jgi:hypothetical protein
MVHGPAEAGHYRNSITPLVSGGVHDRVCQQRERHRQRDAGAGSARIVT